jgi:hypothetical protein
LLIAVACESSDPIAPPPSQVELAIASITFEDVRADIETIAHDSMQGRRTPSPGLESTAEYVASRFADAGLQPGGTEGFFQRFDLVESRDAVNTIGWLEGSDPGLRDEYVIFTAHMDHLGTGLEVDGDSIYNGADDNASGTAVLLELAEAFATLDTRPRRSLVFIALSAEELGLLGAFHYTDNPTFPIESTVANVNMDMVGRNDPSSIAALRSSEEIGGLAETVGDRHPELGLSVTGDLWPGQNRRISSISTRRRVSRRCCFTWAWSWRRPTIRRRSRVLLPVARLLVAVGTRGQELPEHLRAWAHVARRSSFAGELGDALSQRRRIPDPSIDQFGDVRRLALEDREGCGP